MQTLEQLKSVLEIHPILDTIVKAILAIIIVVILAIIGYFLGYLVYQLYHGQPIGMIYPAFSLLMFTNYRMPQFMRRRKSVKEVIR